MNPRKLKLFAEAYYARTDYTAWLNGNYCVEAIGAILGKCQYPEKPHSREQKIEPEHNDELAAAGFAAYAAAFNKQHEKGGGNGGN